MNKAIPINVKAKLQGLIPAYLYIAVRFKSTIVNFRQVQCKQSFQCSC